MTVTDRLANEAALADQLRAERLRSAGLEERIASLEATIASLSAGFASKMATALEAHERRTVRRIASWVATQHPMQMHPTRLSERIDAGAWKAGRLPCDDLVDFSNGEIVPARAEAFRAHLVDCEACRDGLVEHQQIGALLSTLPERKL
jgi:hypothetical protein